jgi:hypothetical protein
MMEFASDGERALTSMSGHRGIGFDDHLLQIVA